MTYLVEDGLKFKILKLYDMNLLLPKGAKTCSTYHDSYLD